MLIVIFRKFVIELQPLIDVRNSFPPNIMRTIEHNLKISFVYNLSLRNHFRH